MAEGHADQAARQPHQRPLGHQPGEQAAAGEADGAQKGELGAPPHHRERLGREDQKAAGQERHGRQHGQIHPVGPRQVGRLVLAGLRGLDQHPGRQEGLQLRPRRLGRHGLGQAQVDAGEPPEPGEALLHRGDVHHRQAAVLRDPGQVAGHAQVQVLGADLEPEPLAGLDAEGGLRRRAEEDTVLGQDGEALGPAVPPPGRRSGQQGRGHAGQGEDIDAQQLQGLLPTGAFASTSTTGLASATSGRAASRA